MSGSPVGDGVHAEIEQGARGKERVYFATKVSAGNPNRSAMLLGHRWAERGPSTSAQVAAVASCPKHKDGCSIVGKHQRCSAPVRLKHCVRQVVMGSLAGALGAF